MSINSTTTQDEVAQRNKINSDCRESLAGDSLTHAGTYGRTSSHGNAAKINRDNIASKEIDKLEALDVDGPEYYDDLDIH